MNKLKKLLVGALLFGTIASQPLATFAEEPNIEEESNSCQIYRKSMEHDEEGYQQLVLGLENLLGIQMKSNNPEKYENTINTRKQLIEQYDKRRVISEERYVTYCAQIPPEDLVYDEKNCPRYLQYMQTNEETYQELVEGLERLLKTQANSSNPDNYLKTIQSRESLIAVYDEKRQKSAEQYETYCSGKPSDVEN